jgi:catechol 2,3-dioxygenase-like lactoylglutathione lyase family enzyme
MKIEGLLHVNIRCSANDLPAIEAFYDDVLGLKAGYRPNFGRPGVWLYSGGEPLIHISADVAEGSITKHRNHTGSVDHVAFKCTGSTEMRDRLKRKSIPFQEQNLESAGYQIFITDPVGTRLELNFRIAKRPNL